MTEPAGASRPAATEFVATIRRTEKARVRFISTLELKHPTGAELKAEIDALFERRPDLSRSRFGKCINGCNNGINDVCKRHQPRPATVAKVRALIANPPEEAIAKVHPRIAAARERGYTLPKHPKKGELTLEEYQRRCHLKAKRIAKARRAKAQERIDAGLSWDSASSATMRFIQRDLEETNAEAVRRSDPVEHALTALRRDRHIVFKAEVLDGPEDHFILRRRSGDEIITKKQLLRMARRAA